MVRRPAPRCRTWNGSPAEARTPARNGPAPCPEAWRFCRRLAGAGPRPRSRTTRRPRCGATRAHPRRCTSPPRMAQIRTGDACRARARRHRRRFQCDATKRPIPRGHQQQHASRRQCPQIVASHTRARDALVGARLHLETDRIRTQGHVPGALT